MSHSLWPHGMQHAWPPCPSPTPRVYSNSYPLSQWWHPTISYTVVLFFSCPQSFPASGSFQMSQLFTSGGQVLGISISLSVISFRMNWLDLLAVQGTLKSRLQQHKLKASILWCSAWKTIALTTRNFAGKVMSLLFNILSRLVITFLPRSKRLLISWLQSPSEVILEPKKIKSDTASTVSSSISHEVMGPDAMILVFRMLSYKPTFFTLLLHFHQEAF